MDYIQLSFFKTNSFVFKLKAFWMLHLNDHLYTKLMCLLWAVNFLCRMSKHFHGLSQLELCLTKNTGSFTRGGVYPSLILLNTSFPLPFHLTVRLCWTSSNGTEPTQSNGKCSVDHNHALTPIQCGVLVHMQCNAPLHVISCYMYNECYMDNTNHTTHRVSWTITLPTYDFHTSFHSCQYIMHVYININVPHVILSSCNETHIIKPCNGHLHI